MKFQCQMVDVDGPNEWSEIDGIDAEDAATEYAEACDNRSGGECFSDPHKRDFIRVKTPAGPIILFDISFDWTKTFYAQALLSETTIEPPQEAK